MLASPCSSVASAAHEVSLVSTYPGGEGEPGGPLERKSVAKEVGRESPGKSASLDLSAPWDAWSVLLILHSGIYAALSFLHLFPSPTRPPVLQS